LLEEQAALQQALQQQVSTLHVGHQHLGFTASTGV
jgi:hypothetical protein